MKKLILFILLSCLLLSGCQTFSDRIPLETKSKAEKDIAALNVAFAAQLKAKDDAVVAAKTAVDSARDAQAQGAADSFYALDHLFAYIPSPLRTDVMWHNFGLEGWASLGHRMPSYKAMLELNERITKELDVTKTSMADLTATHEAEMVEKTKLSDAATAAQKEVDRLNAEAQKIKADHVVALAAGQKKLDDANNAVIAVEKKRADDSAAIQALKTRISIYCAAGALICILAAIYLPVARGVAIVIGLVLGAGGSLIWIITGPEVLAGCGVIALGAVGYLVWQHNTANKGVTAFANLLHEKPELVAAADEWTTKYVKAPDGTVTTVPDTAVQALVKSKLMASDKA